MRWLNVERSDWLHQFLVIRYNSTILSIPDPYSMRRGGRRQTSFNVGINLVSSISILYCFVSVVSTFWYLIAHNEATCGLRGSPIKILILFTVSYIIICYENTEARDHRGINSSIILARRLLTRWEPARHGGTWEDSSTQGVRVWSLEPNGRKTKCKLSFESR